MGQKRPSQGREADMIDEPSIVQTSAQVTAVVRIKIPRSEIQAVMGVGRDELMAALAAQGIRSVGPWFTHHFVMDPEVFDIEIGVPVDREVSAVGRVAPGRLPSTEVARTIYHGPYEGLGAAWSEFDTWITSKGRRTAEGLWEVYVTGPETTPDPSGWQTELNRPLVG